MTPAFLVVVPPLLGGLPTRPATVSGRLWVLDRGAPGLVPGRGARVHGVLVELPDPRLLGLLDTATGGERVELDVRAGLRTVGAWAWTVSAERVRGARPVPSGRWPAGAASR